MTDTFDVCRELASGIGDRAGTWRFVHGFASAWSQSPLAEGDGRPEADLDAAEARLGLRLPVALREAYQVFGRRDDLTSNQDVLLSPAELDLDEEKQTLVFRVENQAVAHWGVPVAELRRPDPSVVVRMSMADRSTERWEPWLDRLSSACVEIVLSESLFASDEELGDNRELEDGEAELLERRYARLPLPGYPASAPAIRWFAGTDVIIRDDQRAWMWVRGRTAESLAAVRADLPGDWMMTGPAT